MSGGLTLKEQEILLGRSIEPLLTMADRAPFAGRRCLITGAGGSVGSELARQIAACQPARLMLVDHGEHALFRIEQELAEMWPGVDIEPVLCDITRAASVGRVFRRLRPSVVFHAAAYKHVTMAERAVCPAANVNILGTEAVLMASAEQGSRFVLISSDKAASPRSVMGATKRCAELLTRSQGTNATVVRFGNVLASSGSFIEVMHQRIRQGRSLVITDPEATRYFMTLTEAASLVMKATGLSRGGETFWLDMGDPVRIGDLAARLLEVTSAHGCARVPIEVIGLRPGEKLIEQLTTHGLAMTRTDHPRIWVAREPAIAAAAFAEQLRSLRRSIANDDAIGVLTSLETTVPEFHASPEAWARARSERLFGSSRSTRRARTA